MRQDRNKLPIYQLILMPLNTFLVMMTSSKNVFLQFGEFDNLEYGDGKMLTHQLLI